MSSYAMFFISDEVLLNEIVLIVSDDYGVQEILELGGYPEPQNLYIDEINNFV